MRQALTSLAEILGVLAVIFGLFLVATPAGFIGGGCTLVFAGYFLATPPDRGGSA